MEIHRASVANREVIYELMKQNNNVLCLTGTLSEDSKWELLRDCGLEVLHEYSTEEAVDDNIVANFRIHLVEYQIDDTIKYWKQVRNKKWLTTEAKELSYLTKKVNFAMQENGSAKFESINRMRFINSCNSLKRTTRRLIKNLENRRFILFGAGTKFLDGLEIHTYHSGKKSDNLNLFIEGKINDLGLDKMANTGVTFPNVDTIILTSINSNMEETLQKIGRSLLLDKENKVSDIYIVTSTEAFQKNWITSSLKSISINKFG